MKNLIVSAAVFVVWTLLITGCASNKASSTTNKSSSLWNQTQAIEGPESTYYDAETGTIFVSNVAGSPDKKDGKGWITRISAATGRTTDEVWVSGLNAPKGIRVFKGMLWVSDIDEVVGINIKTASIEKRIKIKGAKFLNDIAVGSKGELYVSDTMADRIYRVRDGRASVFVEGKQYEAPNGLLVVGNKLVVAAWGTEIKSDFSTSALGHLYSIDLKTKKKALITAQPLGHLDGLEIEGNGNYLVSDWMAGKVFSVDTAGNSKLLFEGFKGAADLGWIPTSKTLIVPRMMENQVSAFQM